MMSVADSDNLQNLLTNLNIDISPSYNNDKKVEKLILQLGELSSRYSDLASRYLKLVNSKVNEPFTNSIHNLSDNISSPNNGIQKSLLEILAEFSNDVSDCLAPSQFNSSTGKFTGDLSKAFRSIIQNFKVKKSENNNLTEVIKSLEQKIDSLEMIIKQMDTEKTKLAEVRVRNEFFSEFEGLIKEDLKKTHILQQKITESLVLIKNSQISGDTSHMDAIFDSLLTELNLQEHLKKMIEKMNNRRLKQDQEIDALCEKISAMENTVLQCEKDKMLFANQKRLFDNEKQELQDKIQKINNQIKEEQENVQKLQIEIEHKKNAYSGLNKAYEMNKNTLEQMKRKDSMVKRHISMQDSDISKLKQKISEQEKLIKNLRDEIQQKTQTIIALSSDKDKLSEQARSSLSFSAQVEESNRKIQILSNNYEQEISKLQGLLRSKQEEKDQIVASYSKLIKNFEIIKKEFGNSKSENIKLREKLDKIKLQHVPSELKKELEKELEILRSENQRLRGAYEAMEIEKNKWRELIEIDGSKSNGMAAKIVALESENDELRRSINSSVPLDNSLLNEERRKNRALEVECEKLNRKVWELTDQINRVNDEQYRVAELLRNNWSSQSIKVEDKLGDRTIDSFVTPLNFKTSMPLQSENGSFDQARYTSSSRNSDDFSSEQKYFEDENKRLMEIVAQVKSDLRQAASQSPNTSAFSP